jgi:hypothetical protein
MIFQCKHEWKILSQETTTSRFEDAVRIIKKEGGLKFTLPHQLTCGKRKHITLVSCDKCGSIKQFVNNI